MKKKELFVLILFSIFFIFLTMNRHSRAGLFNYHSEIWADKAGYNVYLPALFIYNFNANSLPDSIEIKTGMGFNVDKFNNKIISKYPYGVALLQSPFWLVAHLIDTNKTGYTKIYHKAIDVAAVFYFMIGLFFLYQILKGKSNTNIVTLTLIISITATNLLYYAIWETGMSHIYSFATMTIIIYLISKQIFDYKLVLFGLLYFIIRPINVLFLIPIILLFNNNWDIKQRILSLLTKNNIVACVLLGVILIAPQLLYNNYAFGGYFNFYNGEKFDYLLNPKILEVLFAPNNGLFLYSPIIPFTMTIGVLNKNTRKEFICLFLILIIYTYTYGAWWSYMLGCGFGHRGFIDILPVFIIYLFNVINQNIDSKVILIILFLLCIYSLKLTFIFDGCFYGAWDWDWSAFFKFFANKAK